MLAGEVVGQFHDVIEKPAFIVAAAVVDGDEAGMRTADGAVGLDAVELALVMFVLIEALALDDFERAVFAGKGAGEPNFAVAALADAAQELIIGDIHKPEKTG